MDEEIKRLLELVEKQIRRKARMYDGLSNVGTSGFNGIPVYILSIMEESGEIASAITRHRYQLARDECIDVAHSALLLYLAIEKMEK